MVPLAVELVVVAAAAVTGNQKSEIIRSKVATSNNGSHDRRLLQLQHYSLAHRYRPPTRLLLLFLFPSLLLAPSPVVHAAPLRPRFSFFFSCLQSRCMTWITGN